MQFRKGRCILVDEQHLRGIAEQRGHLLCGGFGEDALLHVHRQYAAKLHPGRIIREQPIEDRQILAVLHGLSVLLVLILIDIADVDMLHVLAVRRSQVEEIAVEIDEVQDGRVHLRRHLA